MTVKQFYWADPHFGHKMVCQYENRPFVNVTEMDNALIENYNSVIGPDDRCIWVGDCFLTGRTRAKEIMGKLNGVKIVVLGNHDHSPTQMLNLGFAYACYELKIKIAGYDVLVNHFPYADETDTYHEIKYAEYRPKDTGLWLLHGHTHSTVGKFKNRMINVGVDLWEYKPVAHTFLEKYIQQNHKV